MTRVSFGALRRVIALAALVSSVAIAADAITVTYVNAGPADSRVFVGFDNMASGNVTSDLVADPAVYSRNDTLFGPAVPPFDAMAYSGAELGTNLNAPLGTGTRSVFAPFNPTFFRAHGETVAGTGSYSAHAFAFSGNTTSTSPTAWVVHVDPSGLETPGTPAYVTIDASIAGYIEIVGGSAVADATWNVAAPGQGTVIGGTASQAVAGNSPFADSGSLTFMVPLGSSFDLLVDYDLSTSGAGAGADSTSEITASLVEVSASLTPPAPMFAPVSGAKLLLIDNYTASGKAKLLLLVKDDSPGAIAKGAAADPVELSGTVEIFPLSDPTNRAVYDLDTEGWVANKEKIAKFKNTAAGAGAGGVKIAAIKPDKLIKVVAKNLGDGDSATGDQGANDIDLGALTGGDSLIAVLSLENETDSTSYQMCAQFDSPVIEPIAGGSGTKLLSTTSSLPAACPQ
jgi:hypothetical protein